MFGIEQERGGPGHRDRAVTVAIPISDPLASAQSDAQPCSFGLLRQRVGIAGRDDIGTGWPLPVRNFDWVGVRLDRTDRRGLG